MTDTFFNQMTEELRELNIDLDSRQMEMFFSYYEMLVEKNKVMNLTAITEESQVVSKHFVDSLSLVKAFSGSPFLPDRDISLIDVGTGAGFPGIPLKIAFPEIRLTLLDSLNKRVRFLEDVCESLGLANVECIHGRAEDGGRDKKLRESFDFCVSRAVANLASLSEYCLPFVKTGGCFLSYKSGSIEEELQAGNKAIAILGGKVEDVVSFSLPNSDMSRCLVKIRKIKPCPGKYPRKAGMPSKDPLC